MNRTEDEDNVVVEFSWHAHPAAKHRGRAVVAFVVILAVAAAVYLMLTGVAGVWQNVIWSVAAGAILFATLHRFYFPTAYSIDADGITSEHLLSTRRYHWAQIQRFFVDENGGFLATTRHRPRIRPLQGMHIVFGEDRKEAVRHIRGHLQPGGGG
ncbi:MAG: hypothetical protein KAS72_00160 [Phycisphaerales bacterium]|nr:hypothetical protein [Phycisphaerales bacterium]